MSLHDIPLHEYGISKTRGFLPDETPLSSFNNKYFNPWDDIAANLSGLITSQSVAARISKLPVLDASRLQTLPEFRRAYVVLSFIIHGFIWEKKEPVNLIPPQLSEPFLQVCDRVGMVPVLPYAGLSLWNWRPVEIREDYTLEELDDFKVLTSFTGNRGEDAFYHVPTFVEAEGGHLVSLLLDALVAAKTQDVDFIIKALEQTSETIKKMGTHLPKLYPTLDANFFYHTLRPFLGAGAKLHDEGFSRGLVFQSSDGSEIETKYIAATAGQSSLFQFLDIALGVDHKDATHGTKEPFFEEMRQYMPKGHREFLQVVAKMTPLRTFVESSAANQELVEVYDECMRQLRLWRGKHIAVVSKYIVQPARQAARAQLDEEKSAPDTSGDNEGLKGTGGSALIPFLRKTKDDTIGSKR